ncbi:sensor histidine kinase [Marinitoga litoralis]|uniref:sensor histidine kinase n=1 Tax=Marinitoga litoralis TaxID=570855 RepID=UPI0019620FB8|nr:ATP-binding protein [Marinitoga litoralis]MBM7559360.1 signal transduction histidine kinase [Marinitoga litoralis]
MTLKRRFIFIILIFVLLPTMLIIFNETYITKYIFKELSSYTETTIDDFGFEVVNKIYPTALNNFFEYNNYLKNFSINILDNQRIIDYAKYGLINTVKTYLEELLNSSSIDGVIIIVENEIKIKTGDFPVIEDIKNGYFENENGIYMVTGSKKENVQVFASKKIDRYFLDSLNLSSISLISIIGKKHKIYQRNDYYVDFNIEDNYVISNDYKYPSKVEKLSDNIVFIISFDISQLSSIQNKIKDVFFENISSNLNISLFIWIFISPFLIYFALFYFGKNIETLELSIKSIKEIAKGNFDVNIDVENKENNRYKDLIDSINVLSENLRNMRKEIDKNIETLENEKNTLKYLVNNLYEGIIFFDLDGSIKVENDFGKEVLKEIGEKELKDSKSKIYSLKINDEQKLIEVSRNYLENSLLVLIRDISLEKEMNDLYSLNEKLVEKEKFGRIAAHEIRNPLNSMYLNLQYLKMEFEGNQKIEEISDLIIEQIKTIDSIVGELSSRAIIESDEKKVNINSVISQILNLLKYKLLENSIDVEFNKSNENIYLNANPQRLNQLFYNIINNAIEELENKEDNRKIRIDVSKNNKIINIIIEDNGRGIPEEYKESIFNKPFTTKKYGNGIGLFIVHSIVKELNGDIKIFSSNSGTKVILEFREGEI